jgi:hypothetical protein
MSGNTVLNQDFKEFIQSLNDNEVRYLVVGGMPSRCMGIHVTPKILISG